jgi:uncharacterized Tic20 family protein
MYTMTERLEHAQQNRREEQVIAAILHMSSPWGVFALISSCIVWAVSKSRSRFLTVQALQAFLFQLISLLAIGLMFMIFIAGFYYAMLSGLIAKTGVAEPQLTRNLIIAAIIGFAAIFFFQFIFPLWGIWAGIQILRGNSYQYPLIGRLVIHWTSRKPFIVKPEIPTRQSSESIDGHVIAGLANAAIFLGYSMFLSPILWVTNRPRSQFLTHNLLQASIFQITMNLIIALSYFGVWGSIAVLGLLQTFGFASPDFFDKVSEFSKITYFPFSFGILFGLFMLISGIYVVVATVQAFRGKEFHYPFIGKWLVNYIQ